MQRLRANNTAISDKVRQQRELQRRAILDALTGLYNRRWLDETLPRLVSRYTTSHRPLCLLMVDIDHFKRFNDTFGHVVGDQVLAEMAHRISQSLRTTDIAVRYGGEEFCVLLPDTDLEGAKLAAERLRKAAADKPWSTHAGEPLPVVTLSIGGTALFAGATPQDFIERADKALYRAKHSGRNRAEFAL